ncbi:Uncharacterised protein [Vibrio cholerae]|uniref:Uncharacterized protein n=1 Tax=Vibrio cholerae TaxID=666 RepID=A0A655XED6_VIBCL|nr:Uncharacterised protein [Vibrio cholerae]CRZ90276.1 Uncharacterised protein [Vibrio cholerae]CSA97811.1 Uncharacterised protein [Vibrio cholerae]CSB45818.1 Uncharacterised protein [Vibrio cholerae]CSC05038.1 Uncharacterised protein [Vibrio cholerae]
MQFNRGWRQRFDLNGEILIELALQFSRTAHAVQATQR